MLFKLSLRNVKRSIRDYAIYFTTLILSVAVFFIFNTISNREFLGSVLDLMNPDMIAVIENVITGVSVFVSFILGFLIVYANGFLLKRRMKELGIYLTLGMERRDMGKLLLMETLIIGFLSLIVGIGIGIPLSQVFGTVIFDLMDIYIAQMSFVFSMDVLLRTVLNFGVMFLVVIVLNVFSISRLKIINLIYGRSKKVAKLLPLWLSILSFVIAVTSIGYVYRRVLAEGAWEDIFGVNMTPFMTILGIAFLGTFALFLSLAGLFVFVMEKSKQKRFEGLNVFTMRQISSRIHRNWLSLATTCLMIAISISALVAGRTIDYFMRSTLTLMTPFDVTFQASHGADTNPDLDFSELTDEVVVLREYVMDGLWREEIHLQSVFANFFEELAGIVPGLMWNASFGGFRLDEVNATLAQLGREPLTLADGEILLMVFSPDFNEASISMDGFTFEGRDYVLTPYFGLQGDGQGLWTDFIGGRNLAVFVFDGDELLEDPANHLLTTLHSFNYRGDLRDYEPRAEAILNAIGERDDMGSLWNTRNSMLQMGNMVSILVTFISYFIGMIFLLVSLSVLALQQLVDAVESEDRYLILQKMGVEASMRAKALFVQVAVYSLIPLLMATLHSIVAITFLYSVLNQMTTQGFDNIALMAGSFGLIFAVYLIYFGVTYWQGKRMLVK